MDRALQERIIGAIVLVFFAVLVVPVFLDGPSNDNEISSELVRLPGQGQQQTRQQTIVLTRDRTEPVPQAASAEALTKPPETTAMRMAPIKTGVAETARAPAGKAPASKPPSASSAASSTASSTPSPTGMWAVQMGSFSSKANAERLAIDLRKEGFAAFLSQLKTSSGQLHRVRIGPQKDRNSAESISAQLNKAGHKGQVVPHP